MTYDNRDGRKTLKQAHDEQNDSPLGPWHSMRDKILGIGAKPEDYMITATEHAKQQALAEATRKQYEAYMNQYSPPNFDRPPPKPTSITISFETFQKMQIESGKELLSALSVMMRMEGIDVAEADKITIEIGDVVKVSVKPNIPYDWKYKSIHKPNNYAQSMLDSYYGQAAQQIANDIDRQILDSIRNENKS